MTTSTTIKGAASHFAQIFDKWEGIDMTLRKRTFITDDNEQVVSSSNSDTEIKGVISSTSHILEEVGGSIEDRQIKGVFLYSGTMPVIEDLIIDDSDGTDTTYVIVEIPFVDRDINNPVLITTTLRKVPYGA